ncbi:Maf family protein [Aeoliella sp. ICT_H6.2]|uniref:dTTP/UTP pyrophosphatase n=1 Tax=Aeoliella straminimaris TaxID=2954799 RepID=A0A9X2FEP2_9BACT|nr:Maf family protein [Aeoliella straminimaris]MCO6047319.1 Maf family protein [Aeoliella straminimaris]
MTTPSPELVLASTSPRRQELLRDAGYAFRIVAPDPNAESGVCSSCGPVELVREYALRKGTDVAQKLLAGERETEIVLLAADTVAECQGQILGKPADEEHARRMLQLMRGRQHRVLTGLCLWHLPATGGAAAPIVEVVVTTLKMDAIEDAGIEDYLETGGWEGKAGAFGYQDRLGWIHIEEGSESNVVGLPMERVQQLLTAAQVFTSPRG